MNLINTMPVHTVRGNSSVCHKCHSLQVTPELEVTAERQDLTELHRAMLQQTVEEFIELGKQLPSEYVAALGTSCLQACLLKTPLTTHLQDTAQSEIGTIPHKIGMQEVTSW